MAPLERESDSSITKRLQELIQETDSEFIFELIDIFLQETPGQIQVMQKAILSQDHHALNISAHTLKGSSLNLGAKDLGSACLKLEELARSGSQIPAGTDTRDIEAEFERVKAFLIDFKKPAH